ncbi:sigma-70 family RNA polymerase sigma factor [Flavobacteriaceae bacterium TK19130]|nr:sigma-70 family RNA polymerase sigma factor [Thermobacterium salinum]
MQNKNVHSDQRYVDGLAQNDTAIINAIYKNFVPKVIGYIRKNSGSEAQAQDLIQEVLMVIYDQAHQQDLKLTCPFDAYFFLLCKRKWFNQLKKKRLQKVTINEEIVSEHKEADQFAFETAIFEEKQSLFNDMFKKLGKACQDLLKVVFELDDMKKTAEKLDISYAYARKKKSLCIGQLTELIQASPKYEQLK